MQTGFAAGPDHALPGLLVAEADARIAVLGTVRGALDGVTFAPGAGGVLVNHGTIAGARHGVHLDVGLAARGAGAGAGLSIANHGRIEGGAWGVVLQAPGMRLVNAGTIGIVPGGESVILTGRAPVLLNHGEIAGGVLFGADGGPGRLVNDGEIGYSVWGSGGIALVNRGRMAEIVLQDGDNRLDLRGGTELAVFGGRGNDRYLISGSEVLSESAAGGHDRVTSTGSFDLPEHIEDLHLVGEALRGGGNTQGNRLVGNGLDNRLTGHDGDDVLLGLGGDDRLQGDRGDDRLLGGAGNDDLSGGRGDDRLIGGAGDDRLEGGLGDDVLVGGAGEDRFVFDCVRPSESLGDDRIVDFVQEEDRILLPGFGAGAIRFIGDAAFSGTAPEVRFEAEGSGLRVLVDLDRDGAADQSFRVVGLAALDVHDFIF